jgi:hypothetical protein
MSDTFWQFSGSGQRQTSRTRRMRPLRLRRRDDSEWPESVEIVEIRSGAIIPELRRPGLFCLEVNTARGLRRFEHARENTRGEAQSEIGDQDWEFILAYHAAIHKLQIALHHRNAVEHKKMLIWSEAPCEKWPKLSWGPGDEGTSVESYSEMRAKSLLQPPGRSSSSTFRRDTDEPLPSDVLQRLQNDSLDHQERRRLIIEAEVLDFAPDQLEHVTSILCEFIGEYRESNEPADLVAVGSAIRKCIATLRATEALAYAADLLKAGPRAQVPLEVELELTKMVVRKLTANPPSVGDFLPTLADRLFEITETYLSPRLLARKNYGAITLNAILGLSLLRSRHAAEAIRLVSQIGASWFKQSLIRHARRIQDELKERHPGESLEQLIGSLQDLESQLIN